MKKLSLIIIIYIVLFSGLKAQYSIKIKEKTGTITTYNLNNIRNLAFPAGKLNITLNNNEVQSYMLSNLGNLIFQDVASNLINSPTNESKNLLVYPVPAKDNITIQIHNTGKTTAYIEILSINGKLIRRVKIELIDGTNSLPINISGLTDGLYVCRLFNSANTSIVKFNKTNP